MEKVFCGEMKACRLVERDMCKERDCIKSEWWLANQTGVT